MLDRISLCAVGDSRAVLCRSGVAIPLTDDHKAAREDETVRNSSPDLNLTTAARAAVCLVSSLRCAPAAFE